MDHTRNVSSAHSGAPAGAAPGYYSIGQAAALLGVSRVTMWRWVRAGRLPVARLGHRTARVKREDLERLLAEHRVGGARSGATRGAGGGQGGGAPASGAAGERAPRSAWWGVGAADHLVQFYESDAFLLDAVSDFVGAALRAGDAAIVLATPDHRAALDERLRSYGLDLAAARAEGRYAALDAAAALARCLRDGEPDPERFAAMASGLIVRAAAGGRQVRVFGELVALLAAEGKHAAVTRLEALWNDLQRTHAFSLLCGYPVDGSGGKALAELIGEVCAEHTRIIPAESYTALDDPADRLRAVAVLQQKAQALEAEMAERRRAEDELRERIRQAELAAAVGAALATGEPLQAQLRRCAGAMVAHLDAAFARIWTLNEAERVLELRASAGMYTHLDGPHGRVSVGAYKIGKIAAERRPHLTNDVPADPRISDPDWARREGMVAFAGYPLLVGGRLVGVMALFARQALPASTLDALGAIAHTIAVGIDRAAAEAERARLLRRAREARAEEETLRRVGQVLSAELDQQRLLQAVTDAATRLSGAEHGAFFYNATNGQGEAYHLYTLAGAPKEQFTALPMPRNTELFAPTFSGEAVIRLADVTQDPRFGKNPPYHGLPEGHLPLRSYLAVPVVSRSGEVFGGLFFGHPEPGVFTERAERLVVGIAAQAAIALDNARFYQEAQEAIRVRDDFLAAASHDLKNPLTTIKGTAQLLQRRLARSGTVAPERLREGLAGIGAAATQMTAQLEELLDIARLQSGRPLPLECAPTDLVALAREAAAAHRQATDRHHLRVEATEEAVVGDWDAARLARVLGNLLSNAIKYSPDGGEVGVGVGRAGDRAVLTVRDHGIGIPAADLPHIFERFRRAANAVGQMKGSGIGLSAARHIVEQHGGTVQVESREGQGTTVTVRLPLAVPDA